jgi:glyceraldehyde 3-phosphate dehydrogenase
MAVLHRPVFVAGRSENMTTNVGINGFGRIGRQVLKAILEDYPRKLKVLVVNDLYDANTNAHLFKYDSTYGKYQGSVEVQGGDLVVDGQRIKVLAERDPRKLPWKDLGVELVVEVTGVFRDAIGTDDKPGAGAHIESGGAKKVVIGAPGKNVDLTLVLGVNDDLYDPEKHHIISNASCTTNCLAPVAKIVLDELGIRRGMVTTVHSVTNDQRILDLAHKDLRRARAANQNIIPTSTGAAKALGLVIPELKGKFDGFALRVPTPTVSIIDFVAEVEKATSEEALNKIFHKAATGKLEGILGYTEEPLVSSDLIGDPHSAMVDGLSTMVIDGTLVKVIAWYDNEWAYSVRTADLLFKLAGSL